VSRDKDRTNNIDDDALADELEKLLASPPPSIDDLFHDPAVRGRIGVWLSLVMNRATRARRRRRRQAIKLERSRRLRKPRQDDT
jgi:hypothetical protein